MNISPSFCFLRFHTFPFNEPVTTLGTRVYRFIDPYRVHNFTPIERDFKIWLKKLSRFKEKIKTRASLLSKMRSVCKSDYKNHFDMVLSELKSILYGHFVECVCCCFTKKSAFECQTCKKHSICVDCYPKLNNKSCLLCRSKDIKKFGGFTLKGTPLGVHISSNLVVSSITNRKILIKRLSIQRLKNTCRTLVKEKVYTGAYLRGYSNINNENRKLWENKILIFLWKKLPFSTFILKDNPNHNSYHCQHLFLRTMS